jgi:N6-L-threonylcarbamoyladenine synthase
MRPSCHVIRRFNSTLRQYVQRRNLLTLAIETSCDDTSVAVLERKENNSATLHFHEKVTSDNRQYGGVHPIAAHESHQMNLGRLVKKALQRLPLKRLPYGKFTYMSDALLVAADNGTRLRKKPDFVTVTRGPGMRASLMTGLDTAKGLAVAWQVPLLGVNHMQAHALTPRLVSALTAFKRTKPLEDDPAFPFLTLLVSGGHTMLVRSRSLCDHEVLANTTDIPIGDVIDKCARDILPVSTLATAPDVMYGQLLETFVFPEENPTYEYTPPKSFNSPKEDYEWTINPPYMNPGPEGSITHAKSFTYSGIGSIVKRIMEKLPEMGEAERRRLAKATMEVSFEHLASRVLFALERPDMKNIKTLVVSGGVASNQYLKHIFRTILDRNGHEKVKLLFPPPKFCTDNAAMIAWTGIEMFEAGWRTKLDAMVVRRWSIDPRAEDGGILGIDGWENLRRDLPPKSAAEKYLETKAKLLGQGTEVALSSN